MKKFFAIIAVIVIGSFIINSCSKTSVEDQIIPAKQTQLVGEYHSLGCEFLTADEYAKIPVAKVPKGTLRAAATLVVPPVGDQGGEGSCVAWGTTYAARSIDWQADHTGSWSQSVNIFSPEYVYNQIKVKKACSSGAYVTKGLDLLKTQGVCTWSLMPYTDVKCTTLPTTAQKTAAAAYKITGYSTVTLTTTAIKSFLAAGKPVIVGGPVNSAFMYLANNQVLGAFTGSSLGGHCYCLVGYDDVKGAFKFMNSWGTSWGTSGFGYIAYGYEKSWWTEAYVID